MSDELNIEFINEMDRGLAYAEACFETFRIINGEIFLWSEHFLRLSQGLATFGLNLTATDEKKLLSSCLQQAKQTADDCLLRLTISGGAAPWGLLASGSTRCYIQAFPFQPNQQQLEMLSVEYPFPLSPKSAKYSADYSETLRAIQCWKQQTPEVNPHLCLIEKKGLILSGLTANILLYVDDQWLTPAGDGILPGLIRLFLMQQGLVKTQTCPVHLLEKCEVMLMINSGQFIRPVHSINGRTLQPHHPSITAIADVLVGQPGVKLESN